MTTDEFITEAKNLIRRSIKHDYGEYYKNREIQVIELYCHFRSKKGIFNDGGINDRIYVVTYDDRDEMLYVDSYIRLTNHKHSLKEIRG